MMHRNRGGQSEGLRAQVIKALKSLLALLTVAATCL